MNSITVYPVGTAVTVNGISGIIIGVSLRNNISPVYDIGWFVGGEYKTAYLLKEEFQVGEK